MSDTSLPPSALLVGRYVASTRTAGTVALWYAPRPPVVAPARTDVRAEEVRR